MRKDSKSVVLTLCAEVLSTRQHQYSLTIISLIFNKLNRIYHSHVEEQHKANAAVLVCSLLFLSVGYLQYELQSFELRAIK